MAPANRLIPLTAYLAHQNALDRRRFSEAGNPQRILNINGTEYRLKLPNNADVAHLRIPGNYHLIKIGTIKKRSWPRAVDFCVVLHQKDVNEDGKTPNPFAVYHSITPGLEGKRFIVYTANNRGFTIELDGRYDFNNFDVNIEQAGEDFRHIVGGPLNMNAFLADGMLQDSTGVEHLMDF